MTKKHTDEMAATDEVEDFTDQTLDAPPEDAQEDPQVPEQATDDTGAEDEPDKGGREAAKYRRRLRDTEAERDALTERVEALQRSVVDGIAATEGRIHARALWAAGTELGDLLDDDGDIDPDKVLTACDRAAAELGITRRPRPNPAQREEAAEPRVSPRESMAGVVMGKRG